MDSPDKVNLPIGPLAISRHTLRALRDQYALLHCEMQVRAARYSTALEQDYSHTVSWLNQIHQLCEGNWLSGGFFGLYPTYSLSRDGIESRGEADLDTWSAEFRSMVSEPGRMIGVWRYQSLENLIEFLCDSRPKCAGIRSIGATRTELVMSLSTASIPDWFGEYPGPTVLGSHW